VGCRANGIIIIIIIIIMIEGEGIDSAFTAYEGGQRCVQNL